MSKISVGSMLDNYRILEEIGRGGMGVVYKALNIHLDKFVAIKVISLGLAGDEIFTNRFRTEARALAKLEDPNIVNIYDLRADDIQWFIVMEYVEGITLSAKIKKDSAIPSETSLLIFKQLLRAIGHAHRVGIIHRDIKPTNVMITRNGVVKVTDFGLAKDLQHDGNTAASSTGGTLYYMSPEQVRGLHYTDSRSDIYSLGLTLYEMLAGQIPIRKDDTDFDIREAIIRKQFPPPTYFNPKIPVELNAVVMRAIEKNPDDRYQNVDELLEAIQLFERNQGLKIRPDQKESITEVSWVPGSSSTKSGETKEISYLPPEDEITSMPVISTERPQKSISWRPLALTAAAVVIILCILFLIPPQQQTDINPEITDTVPEIDIISSPEKAVVFIAGDSVGITPLKGLSAGASPLSVRLEKHGFDPLDTVITFAGIGGQSFRFSLSPASEPVIAGKSDKISESPKQQGEKQALEVVTPLAYDPQDTETEPVPETALYVETQPAGATIKVDGRVSGISPMEIADLQPGEYVVQLTREGFQTYSRTVQLGAAAENSIVVDLLPLNGDIEVSVKPWGTIYVDGNMVKQNTNVKFNSSLAAGDHNIRIVHPTLGIWEKDIRVTGGEKTDVAVDFTQLVSVRVTAFDAEGNPVWADILVDNISTGISTPKEIEVRVGRRTIAARKDGYILVNGERELMLDSNLPQPIRFILRKVM